MSIWRICSRRYAHSAFSGEGAYESGGRWNPPGYYVVYTSGSLSLATLEFFVNLETRADEAGLIAVSAEIPDSVKVLSINLDDLPSNWRVYPAPASVQSVGARWVEGCESAVLSVPSVLIPGERNYLLNPEHPHFQEIMVHKPESFDFDARMSKGL